MVGIRLSHRCCRLLISPLLRIAPCLLIPHRPSRLLVAPCCCCCLGVCPLLLIASGCAGLLVGSVLASGCWRCLLLLLGACGSAIAAC